MPANLPPQYSKAEDQYRAAATPADRLEALRVMFRLLPKHKGTEKLQSDLKQKISRAKEEIEGGKAGAKKAGLSHRVPREGAGQVVLVGAPNVGKSAILAALTNARPEVAPFPFTTRAPYPGMMAWEDVRVQLVDLPPITPDFLEPWLPGLVRSADAALLVVDLGSDDVADAAEAVLARLAESPRRAGRRVAVRRRGRDDPARQDAAGGQQARRRRGRRSAGRAPRVVRPAIPDRADFRRRGAKAWTTCAAPRTIYWVSCGSTRKSRASRRIGRSRSPSRSAAPSSTWRARSIATSSMSLKFARIWGTGVFEGQTVKRDHELHDADVVELHV